MHITFSESMMNIFLGQRSFHVSRAVYADDSQLAYCACF